jgi:hypothetical protein
VSVAKRIGPLVVAVLTVGGVLVGGCSPTATISPSPSEKPSAALTPVPSPPCNPFTPEATRQVVVAFLDAYNTGAPDIADRFIAPADQFQWYGAPARQYPEDPASTDRGTLAAYFAAQHTKGDRLELKTFSYSGITYTPQIVGGAANFGYTLIHSVGGSAPHDAPGKGAVACRSGKLAVWLITSW